MWIAISIWIDIDIDMGGCRVAATATASTAEVSTAEASTAKVSTAKDIIHRISYVAYRIYNFYNLTPRPCLHNGYDRKMHRKSHRENKNKCVVFHLFVYLIT